MNSKILKFYILIINLFLVGCSPNVKYNQNSTYVQPVAKETTKKLATYSNPKYVTASKEYHIVKRRDNLTKISTKYNLSVEKLKLYNQLESDTIFLGQKVYLTPNVNNKNIFITTKNIPLHEYHIIKKGEDLFTISKMYDIYIMDLIDYNLLDSYNLPVGSKIWLKDGHTSQVDKSIKEKITQQQVEEKKKRQISSVQPEKKISKKREPIAKTVVAPSKPKENTFYKKTDYIKPINNGTVVAMFGQNGIGINKGIDISANQGEPVHSIYKGRVIFSGVQRGYGNVIVLEHSDKVMTVYAHNETNLVRTGDRVAKGQPIATVGQTGRAEEPKLHFEFRVKGKAIDPAEIFEL